MDAKLLDRLEAQCSRREYCVSDIRAKALKATGGDAVVADEIVASLVSGGYVDNGRYAAAFARDKSSLSGWGPVKIRLSLSAKGISSDDIRAALEGVDPGRSDARLDRLIAAKRKSLEGDPQQKLKLLRYLLGRGYEYDAVVKAIERN